MADSVNELIKKIAMAAFEESKPVVVVYGEVTNAKPLEITIDQKLKLSKEFLLLTNAVSDHDVYMTVDHKVQSSMNHSHDYTGKKKFRVHNALKKGEKVILVRFHHGQKFLVLDRLVM